MFKKPLSNLKTSAPLKSSDRRKIRQRVAQTHSVSDEVADLLVPEGLKSVKFVTHLDDDGVAYLSPEGGPLWFTIGKNSDKLIPTVYTLWKHPDLLPFLSTPSQVIPVLVGGADLMIPGVVQCSSDLHEGQLVSISQYEPGKNGPPLAVGEMAVDGATVETDGMKGKAVRVFHTWKDHLWDMGAKGDPPEAVAPQLAMEEESAKPEGQTAQTTPLVDEEDAREATASPQEVTASLRTALLQAIRSVFSKLPLSTFPISATIFYSTYILPSRHASLATSPTPIDIKHSTHKSLTAFLKACEKEGLLKLKEVKSEVVVTAVFPKHHDIVAHRPFTTIKDLEVQREKKEEWAEQERNKVKEMEITEMYKPHQQTVKFFEEVGRSPSDLYLMVEIRSIINSYITDKQLVNPREQSYINIDPLLHSTLTSAKSTETLEFLKREDVIKRIVGRMQNWYEIEVEGKDAVVKKGELKPISIVVKIRQGRKASTLITNFEPYFLTPEYLAEELRRICASATSVSPVQGKTAGMEVLVQGKQIPAVTALLMAHGVPKKWIEGSDLSGAKKK